MPTRCTARRAGQARPSTFAEPHLDPDLSARQVATAAQLAVSNALLIVCALAGLLAPGSMLLLLNVAGAAFFFGVSALRFVAAGRVTERRAEPMVWRGEDDLPVYTVLVPLYREAAMAAQVVAALRAIDWPADRLDVLLIVEDDDAPTRRAVATATIGTRFRTIVVHGRAPRTKPRALMQALPRAKGDFVTVYDAEDRPHPLQLREAYSAFRRAGPQLACVQAPLLIGSDQRHLLGRMFALEYSALFDGLLPTLAELGLPVPLGGTSNHLRRAALDRVGGWDPYNMTEDADLGIRLARFGYRTGVIRLPTYEEAPHSMRTWLRQRTRWLKGWLQTWLVHTRRPVLLARQIGLRQVAGFTLMGLGMLVSAIVHPIQLAALALLTLHPILPWQYGNPMGSAMTGLYLFNLIAAYFAAGLLTQRTLAMRGRARGAWLLLILPFYWLLMSLAAVRAIGQLMLRPHHWEKTPHRGRTALSALWRKPAGLPGPAQRRMAGR